MTLFLFFNWLYKYYFYKIYPTVLNNLRLFLLTCKFILNTKLFITLVDKTSDERIYIRIINHGNEYFRNWFWY